MHLSSIHVTKNYNLLNIQTPKLISYINTNHNNVFNKIHFDDCNLPYMKNAGVQKYE